MQFISTINKKIPVYNIKKTVDANNVPTAIVVSFRESEVLDLLEELMQLLRDSNELKEFVIVNEANVVINSYYQYSKLDEISYKYNYVISPYVPAIPSTEAILDEIGNIVEPEIEGQEERQAIIDNLITATLFKQNEIEAKIDATNETVNAITIAIAEMMGV